MDPSPDGNDIAVVFGNADGIIARGQQIENLGGQMTGAAGVLKAIADNGVPEKGLSIDKIKEVVGEIHEELALAGKRYTPTGTALIAYGKALGTVQGEMSTIVPSCQEKWDAYVAARGHFDNVNVPMPTPAPGPAPVPAGSAPPAPSGPTPEELAHQSSINTAHSQMEAALQDFLDEARLFDNSFDSWESAFEAAADSIGTATDGGIQDGFWDNVDGFVDGVLKVLQVAGIILAVLAFIVGGPIIAALGAIVAIATLALTIYKASRGHSSPLELTLAIIGVIPFGSLAKFAGGFKPGAGAFLNEMVGGLGTAAGRSEIFTAVGNFSGAFSTARTFGAGAFTSTVSAFHGSAAIDDIAARIAGMGMASDAAAAMSSGGWGVAGQVLGHYGWVVNSPGQIVLAGIDYASEATDDADVDSWQQQLATAG
ncbi:MAG: hypothetical protein ABWX82_13245 [Leifsonia sp.]